MGLGVLNFVDCGDTVRYSWNILFVPSYVFLAELMISGFCTAALILLLPRNQFWMKFICCKRNSNEVWLKMSGLTLKIGLVILPMPLALLKFSGVYCCSVLVHWSFFFLYFAVHGFLDCSFLQTVGSCKIFLKYSFFLQLSFLAELMISGSALLLCFKELLCKEVYTLKEKQ